MRKNYWDGYEYISFLISQLRINSMKVIQRSVAACLCDENSEYNTVYSPGEGNNMRLMRGSCSLQ